jgi:hypothetical protein
VLVRETTPALDAEVETASNPELRGDVPRRTR